LDGIFDRLGKVLLSWLRSSSHDSTADPHIQEAWDELNAYLNGDEDYHFDESAHYSSQESRGPADDRSRAEMQSLREDYAILEVPFGAPFEQVRRSYKKMLRRYHPDRHSSDPEKLKLATEITTKINESYNRIKSYSEGTSGQRRP
jgi:hypothetical protein